MVHLHFPLFPMKKFVVSLTLLPALVLVACLPEKKPLNTQRDENTIVVDLSNAGSPADVSEIPEDSEEVAVEKSGDYIAYSDGVIGNGEESVLFFSASWCPSCQANDGRLSEWYGSQELPLTTYSVDYDTYTDLRSRYGIVMQDTFVKIDGSGNAVATLEHPVDPDAELLAFING